MDGMMHVVVSSAIVGFVKLLATVVACDVDYGQSANAWWIGRVAGLIAWLLVVVVFKELVYDKWMKRGTCEWHDVGCDTVGLFIGLL